MGSDVLSAHNESDVGVCWVGEQCGHVCSVGVFSFRRRGGQRWDGDRFETAKTVVVGVGYK